RLPAGYAAQPQSRKLLGRGAFPNECCASDRAAHRRGIAASRRLGEVGMLFQSQAFILLFLPVAVTSYYLVAGSAASRQCVLIAASLFFYGWWDARFIALLVGQISLTWLLARCHGFTKARIWLKAGI